MSAKPFCSQGTVAESALEQCGKTSGEQQNIADSKDDDIAHGVRNVRNPNASVAHILPTESHTSYKEAEASEKVSTHREAQEPKRDGVMEHKETC